MNDLSNNLHNFYSSYLNNNIEEINNQLLNLNIENINNIRNHYLCTKCLNFPYIKFCKDKKHIRLTCSCYNNKRFLITDLFEENILSIENNNNIDLLSSNSLNLNDKIENGLKCIEHNKKFKGFSKICLNNYCQSCIDDSNIFHENDIIIMFDDIKIEDTKIEDLFKIISNNNKIFDESNSNNSIKIINKNNGICEKISEEDEKKFNNLINIIINDYKNYPHFMHFINIKNLLILLN